MTSTLGKLTIDLRDKSGGRHPEEVDAWFYGPLAVHRDVASFMAVTLERRGKTIPIWAISHARSGWLVVQGLESEVEARGLAQEAAALPWHLLDEVPKDDVAAAIEWATATPERRSLKEAFAAMAQRWIGGGIADLEDLGVPR